VPTTKRSLEQKSLQLMREQVDGWCYSDIVRQCISDPSDSYRKGSAIYRWFTVGKTAQQGDS